VTEKTLKPLPKAPAGGIVRTSLDNSWKTPPRILEAYYNYADIGLIGEKKIAFFDPAGDPTNHTKATLYCAPGAEPADGRICRSGLELDWRIFGQKVWVNPPYGRELRGWLAKITEQARLGVDIVALLPCARWEQAYFTEVLAEACAVCFLRKRIAFISSIDGKPVGGNPYANMLLGFNCGGDKFGYYKFRDHFAHLGRCFQIAPVSKPEEVTA
jgi:hypothetical protein